MGMETGEIDAAEVEGTKSEERERDRRREKVVRGTDGGARLLDFSLIWGLVSLLLLSSLSLPPSRI